MFHFVGELQTKHVHELQLVDEKVRQALHKKDVMIHNLQSQLEQINQENKEAESMLMDLNSNIKPSSYKNSSGSNHPSSHSHNRY
jgi:hypothetical protein